MSALQTVSAYIKNLANAVTGRSVPSGVTSGSVGFSAGGPLFLDAFHSKRPPTPPEIVNSYKSIAYSCIRLNQHGVARTPLKLYARTSPRQARPRRSYSRVASLRVERYIRSQPHLARALGPDDAVDEIKEHPFLEALDKPNPYFDGDLLLQHIVASMEVVGTAYLYPTRPLGPDGDPDITQARVGMEIWPFQAQYVYPYKGMGVDELLKEYRYFGDSYPRGGLVRIRYVSLRDPYLSAYSPLHACFEQAGLTDYYYAIVESILKTGARPSMMISPKDANVPLGEQERLRIETNMNNRFTGGRSGHIWVNNGAMDVKELMFPPADLAGLQITENMRLLIANCFDVPISLLQAEDTNRAVASEGSHQHQYYAIEPRCRAIASALTQQLAQPVDDRLFFCFDNPVARDDERETKIWGMKLADGRATANEAREDEGLEPVEWGDEPWLAGTLKQPSQLEEAHEQGLKAQEQGLAQGADKHQMAKESHEDGLKTSDQSRKHSDERLNMEKSAQEMDAEDRAKKAKDKERTLDLRAEEIDLKRSMLGCKYRIQKRNVEWKSKVIDARNKRGLVELEKSRVAASIRKEELKVERSRDENLASIETDKLEIKRRRLNNKKRKIAIKAREAEVNAQRLKIIDQALEQTVELNKRDLQTNGKKS